MKFNFPLKVAIIDDEPDLIDVYEFTAEQIKELAPVSFSDPYKALAAIQEERIPIVVTDINMPSMKGDDLIKKCTHLEWSIDFIVTTGIVNMTTSYRCFRLGAVDVLMKPINPHHLSASLERVIDRYRRYNGTLENIIEKKK